MFVNGMENREKSILVKIISSLTDRRADASVLPARLGKVSPLHYPPPSDAVHIIKDALQMIHVW